MMQIVGTLLIVAGACLISGASVPPGNVPRQLIVAAIWFMSGMGVCRLWLS